MQFVSQNSVKWADRVKDLLFVASLAVMLIYGMFGFIFQESGEELGLKIGVGPFVLAIVSIFNVLVSFRFLANRMPRTTSLLAGLNFYALVGLLIVSTGGLASPYVLLWSTVVLFVGVYGIIPLVLIWLSMAIYFVVGLVMSDAESGFAAQTTNFIILQIPVILSGLWWFNSELKPQRGAIDILSSSLEDEKRKADIVINSIADGVVAVDDQGEIKLFNPAAQEILGWSWDEAMNLDHKSVVKLVDDHDQAVEAGDNPFTAVLKTNKTVSRKDLGIKTKSDKRLEISIIVSPIKNKDGSVGAAIAVFRDESDERKQQKQRAEFISTASHEMRTPVAAIEGYLALALNEKVAKVDTKARDYLNKALESTRHLGKLFQDLLTSAKAEDGRLTSHPKVVNIGELVDKLVEDVRFTAEKKKLLLDLGQPGEGDNSVQPIYYAHVDPDRIREVVTNIFDNAVKYTEEGRIQIAYTGDQENITISVADTGPGIPQEDIPHLFQKFYRVDSSATRQVGGTGLGLFITRKIVELYGGRIWVESRLGQGSVFYISLPRLNNQQAQEMLQAEAASATPLSEVRPTQQQ